MNLNKLNQLADALRSVVRHGLIEQDGYETVLRGVWDAITLIENERPITYESNPQPKSWVEEKFKEPSEAWLAWQEDQKTNPQSINPYAFVYGYNVATKRMQQQIEKLQAFKDYVHERLDDMGIPVDPESPHKAAGCRIGGRLDIVEDKINDLRDQI